MKYVIAICGAPFSTQAPSSAYRFARALLKKQHIIGKVFFYSDGVYIASAQSDMLNTQEVIQNQWIALANKNHFSLELCISAALKRGLVKEEQNSENKMIYELNKPFELSSLTQLLDYAVTANRFVTFGS